VTVTEPLALPADVGVKTTLKVALCPAVSVTGVLTPLSVNPVPLIATCEIVTLVPPVLVTVSDSDWLLPTVTLPKLKLAGLGDRAPADTPVPDNIIVSVELEALDVTVTEPLALPADVGAKPTLKVVLCPAVSVTGVLTAPSLNPVPLTATCEIVTLVPPVLVTVSDSDWLLPTVTLPKFKLDGLETSCPLPPAATPVPESDTLTC